MKSKGLKSMKKLIGFAMIIIIPINIYILMIMAIVAAAVEMVVDELDDNLMVPIFTGLIGQLLTFIL